MNRRAGRFGKGGVGAGAALATILLTTACDPVTLGVAGTAAAGGTAAAQERSVSDAISDQAIRISINDLWLREDLEMYNRLSLTVTEGRVLVTGQVPTPEERVTAIRLVWQVDGVKEVINEIQVADSGGLSGYARDAWISTQLRSRLAFDGSVSALNYSIDTVGGTIYIMGIAQNQAELDRVIAHARNIPYVQRVVPYVRMAGEPVSDPAANQAS
ncbi:BON domain-containing protein [Inquilinus sp. CAU 1745]|uniref:BON domain-containing protein n=1 Tax=Inquilinus sp. CAU 1745 TaxID=3140369 RepID=UPI00325ACC6D